MLSCWEQSVLDTVMLLWNIRAFWKLWRRRRLELKWIQSQIKFLSWLTILEIILQASCSQMIILSLFPGTMKHDLSTAYEKHFSTCPLFSFQWRSIFLGRSSPHSRLLFCFPWNCISKTRLENHQEAHLEFFRIQFFEWAAKGTSSKHLVEKVGGIHWWQLESPKVDDTCWKSNLMWKIQRWK